MGKMVAGLSFCFQHDGETHLPNQGGIGFLLSTSCGETYLPKRRMSATIRSRRVLASPVAADHLDFWMKQQPCCKSFLLPIWEEFDWLPQL